jgi:U5 small nuclear ribonucleoprotein component
VKQYNRDDRLDFDLFGRVLNGSIQPGQKVKILGAHYSLEDEEDMHIAKVSQVSLFQGRYIVPLQKAYPGNWVLLSHLDQAVNKTATIVSYNTRLSPLLNQKYFYNESLCKVAIEPVVPSELPKMLEGIRKLNKTYPCL